VVRVVNIDPELFSLSIIVEASEVVLNGGLVVYPTDTVYGLAANPLDPEAIMRAIEAKRRDWKPMPVIVSSIKSACNLVHVNEDAFKLMRMFWPGPLTIVLPKREFVPDILTAGLPSLGVRMPNNLVALRLAELCYGYILGTSANISGNPPPRTAIDAIRQLGSYVDLVIDAGPSQIGVPSTVIDLTGEEPVIVREGAIKIHELENALGIKLKKKD